MMPVPTKVHINQLYALIGIILITLGPTTSFKRNNGPPTTTTTPRPTTSGSTTSTPGPTTSTPRPTTSTPRPTTSTPRPTTSTPGASNPYSSTANPGPTTTTPRPITVGSIIAIPGSNSLYQGPTAAIPDSSTTTPKSTIPGTTTTIPRPITPESSTATPGPTTRRSVSSSINTPGTNNTMYMNYKLDNTVLMDYNLSYEDISPIECGRLCTSISGCRLFNYQNNSCYILNMVIPGTGRVTVKSIYVDATVKDKCQLPGYTAYIGGLFCIKVVEQQASDWMTSNTTCNQDGGHLLIMKSGVFDVKKYVLETISLVGISYWIGGDDLDIEGAWKWSDGSPIISDAWSQGSSSNGADCLMLHNLDFNGAECGNVLPFICEQSTVFGL